MLNTNEVSKFRNHGYVWCIYNQRPYFVFTKQTR